MRDASPSENLHRLAVISDKYCYDALDAIIVSMFLLHHNTTSTANIYTHTQINIVNGSPSCTDLSSQFENLPDQLSLCQTECSDVHNGKRLDGARTRRYGGGARYSTPPTATQLSRPELGVEGRNMMPTFPKKVARPDATPMKPAFHRTDYIPVFFVCLCI